MEKSIILNLILLLIYSFSVIAEGYMDGYNKKNNKMLHGLKLISHGSLLTILFVALFFTNYIVSPFILIGFIVIRKPFFDYSYSIGFTGKSTLIIGTTSLTDKIIRWLKLDILEIKTGIPVLGFLYMLLIFTSLVITIELGK